MRSILYTLIILILSTFYSVQSNANSVDRKTASLVAINFLRLNNLPVDELRLVENRTSNGESVYFIFNYCDHGFIIISGDNRTIPVLGYSSESDWQPFTDTIVGLNVRDLLVSYESQIAEVKSKQLPSTNEIAEQWARLLGNQSLRSNNTVVPPLLTTTWNQGWPYNSLCPADPAGPGGHVWAGCTATAMAQVLKYHNYPTQGLGSFGYTYNAYPYTGANFGATTYNWANMPNSISVVNNDVSTITYHAAVSIKSAWSSSGTASGLAFVQLALPNYFKMAYANLKLVIKSEYSSLQWDSILQNELINNRPVLYAGSGNSGGHAFVCDGVDANNLYHLNLGWGGTYNGYYSINNINPGGSSYNDGQNALVGIKPNDGSTIIANTSWTGVQNIENSMAVADGIKLTINPGSEIKFSQGTKLQIYGSIYASGTTSDSIMISANNPATEWLGMKFGTNYANIITGDNDSSLFNYCRITHATDQALYLLYYNKLQVNHSTFQYNSGWYGGAVYLFSSDLLIKNSKFINNTAVYGGAMLLEYGTLNTIIQNNTITYNTSTINGAIDCRYGSTIIKSNIISNNSVTSNGGAIGCYSSSTTIQDNTITYNSASNEGGALYFLSSAPFIKSNFICNNTAGYTGGAIYYSNSSGYLINNLLANNTGYYGGGGLRIQTNSNPLVINNTIVHNISNAGGGANIMGNSNPIFKNCIIYGNNNYISSNQVAIGSTDSDPSFYYCDILGGLSGFAGAGAGANYSGSYQNNLNIDPEFTLPSGASGTGYSGMDANWQLIATSPCIDVGTPDTTGLFLPLSDLAGNPRITNNHVDIGSYEYICTIPAQPSEITGPVNPCSGTEQSYSVTYVPGVTYTWSLPAGWSISSGQGTNVIYVYTGTASGTITVTPSSPCGNGSSRALSVSVTIPPVQPSPITGESSPCVGSTQTYSVTNVSGINYTWQVPAGWTINSGQGSNTIYAFVGNTGGTVVVTPSNASCSGPSQSLPVTTLSLPGNTGTINGPNNPCQNSTASYSIAAVVNAIGYNWSVPAGWSITAGANTTSINVSTGTIGGNITVTAYNSCGMSNTSMLTITMTNSPVVNAGNDQTINYGTSTTLQGNSSGGSGNYQWHWEPAGMLLDPDIQNPSTINLTSSIQFILTVTDVQNGCSGNDQVEVIVTGGPLTVIATATPNPVCTGEQVQLNATTGGGSGSYSFTWTSVPPGFNSSLQNPVDNPTSNTVYIVTVNDGNACVTDSIAVTIISVPAIPSRPVGPAIVHTLYTPQSEYHTNAIATAVSYIWEITPSSGAGVISGTDTSAIVDWNLSYLGDVAIKVKALNSCGESGWSEEKLTFVDNTTGLTELDACIPEIFPNPVTNKEITIKHCRKIEKIYITDSCGRLMFQNNPGSMQYILHLDLPKGVYIAEIVDIDGNKHSKLILY